MREGKLYRLINLDAKTGFVILADHIDGIPATGRLPRPSDWRLGAHNFRQFRLGEIFMHICTVYVEYGTPREPSADELHSIFLFEDKLWVWDQSIEDQEDCFEMVSK